MKDKKQVMSALLGKLKVETIGIQHRSTITSCLFWKKQYFVARISFDDYGDLMLDNDSLTILYDTYTQLKAEYPEFAHDHIPSDDPDNDKAYHDYCRYDSIRRVLKYVGILD